MTATMARLLMIVSLTIPFTVFSESYGETMVNNALNMAKKAVCKTIDGTIVDTGACDHLTKDTKNDSNLPEDDDGASMKLYSAAVEKLGNVLSSGRSAFKEFMESQGDSSSTIVDAYDAIKTLRNTLISAGNDVNSAFANLGSAQTYVGDAQRWLMSVYNEFMEKLKLGDEEESDEITKSKANAKQYNNERLESISNEDLNKEQLKNKESEKTSGGTDNKSNKKPAVSDLYVGLQETYDKVSQAAAMVLEKAYNKVNDLGKDAIKATLGIDDPTELSPEKAQKAFGDMKKKATDILQRATSAAKQLAEQHLQDGGEEAGTLEERKEGRAEKKDCESELLDTKEPLTPKENIPENMSEDVETATSPRFEEDRHDL